MKKIFPVLLLIIMLSALTASAQTKKPTAAKKPVAATKKANSTNRSSPSKATTTNTAKTSTYTEASKSPAPKKVVAANNTSLYNTALGIKFLYGISLTAKHFIKDNSALEGIFSYRGFGGLGTQIGITALYEYQRPIADVPNLQWYLGGGAHFQYFSFDDADVEATTVFGAAGVLGLEYKFSSLPIAISADWQPIFTVNKGGGFSAENGGIGIKYTF